MACATWMRCILRVQSAAVSEMLVTTDDAFISAARRLTPASSTRVVNPVVYALEVLQ